MSPLDDVGQRTENSSSTCPSCYVGGEGTRLIRVSHVKGMLIPRLQTFRCSDSRTEPFLDSGMPGNLGGFLPYKSRSWRASPCRSPEKSQDYASLGRQAIRAVCPNTRCAC